MGRHHPGGWTRNSLIAFASMLDRSTFLLRLSLGALLCPPSVAAANGQSTHVWISVEALERLPSGPVSDLLRRPELLTPLVNGTMFPDWGYASGDRDHGEASHWEPFQQEYLRWIQESFEAPYSEGEAAQHVAFLFGMASHGMADEHFDSLFMEHSRCYDTGWTLDDVASLDTASDVLFMSQVGGIATPEPWLPTEALTEVYARAMPQLPLDTEGLAWGNELLHVAIAAVDALKDNEERVATFTALYPWSAERFLDETTPGSPPTEADAVAAYWLAMWERLQGTADFDAPVALMTPAPGSYGHALTAEKPEGRLHLAFAHGVRADTLDKILVSTAQGAPIDVEVSQFYGDLSHAVLARPLVPWEADTDYILTIEPGLEDTNGLVSTVPWSATFSTRTAPDPVQPGGEPPGCQYNLGPAHSSLYFAILAAFLGARRRRDSVASSN